MIRKFLRKYLKLIINLRRYGRYNIINGTLERRYKSEIEAVLKFHKEYNDFRLVETCAEVTQLDIRLCKRIKEYLYEKRLIGNYYFAANTSPQKFMRELILSNFPFINHDSMILEVGPGNFPVFSYKDFKNWFGVDKFFEKDRIKFKNLNWANNQYPSGKICKGAWETLSESTKILNTTKEFDLIVSSHSYEHCFKPITSLIECHKLLKKDGVLVLFVPDGFSDHPSARNEMTHSLYLVPDMIEEFFKYAGGFYNLEVIPFRPNADYAIIARKE